MSALTRLVPGVIVALLVAVQPLDAQDGAAPAQTEILGTITPSFAVADQRLLDLDGDGREELVVIGRRGEVRTWAPGDPGRGPLGSLVLSRPERSLLALATLLDASALQLIVAAPDGVRVYRPGAGGAFDGPGELVARRARFRLRVGQPTFSNYIQDLDGDGLADVVLPRGDESCELWMNRGGAAEAGSEPQQQRTARVLRKAATIPVTLKREEKLELGALSDRLSASFTVPKLDIRDLNGDERPDLVVQDDDVYAFHIQRADGTIPRVADETLRLKIFRDSTREGNVRLGRPLPGQRRAQLSMRDINGDEIPDFVITHLRKIWVFHGGGQAPRFERPVQILKLAEDITWLQVMNLDGDENPDLAMVRFVVPTLATFVQGIFAEWDVGVTVLDYRNLGDGRFADTPRRTREITLRVPAITSLITNVSTYLNQVEEAVARFRETIEGDFDGDGTGDVAMVTEDEKHLEIWTGVGGSRERAGEAKIEGIARWIFFEDPETVWDLDRMLGLFGDLGTQRALELTKGRAADAVVELRAPEEFADVDLLLGDIDGDGGCELILSYRRAGKQGAALYDIVRVALR